jgi:hypothetical protein
VTDNLLLGFSYTVLLPKKTKSRSAGHSVAGKGIDLGGAHLQSVVAKLVSESFFKPTTLGRQ